MSLCVISVDRYIGVTRPLQHSTIVTEKRALIIVFIVWILAVAISVAPLIGWKEPPSPDPLVCTVTQQIGYVMFSISGSFYIPLIIIMAVYFRIYREASKQSKFLSTGMKVSKGVGNQDNGTVTLRVHHGRSATPQTIIQPLSKQPPATVAPSNKDSKSVTSSAKDCTTSHDRDKFAGSSSSDQSDNSGKRYHSR